MDSGASSGSGFSRRRFLTVSAATGALLVPAARIPAGAAETGDPPPDFPSSIPLYQQAYENWAHEIESDEVRTCQPRTPQDVVLLANWACRHGYTLRAEGFRHGWSPLTVVPGDVPTKVVLLDTTTYLTNVALVSTEPAAVRAQTGIAVEDLLHFLARHGLGVTNTPAPGDLTLGGVLAIGGHGSSLPADGEVRGEGHTFGSLTNLVVSLTAVVWDDDTGRYVLREFDRGEPRCSALLACLGRGFITEATLRVGADRNLRCVSRTDIPATELFASPGAAGETFTSFVARTGRADAIWFPFTANPWLQVWSVSPTKPAPARATDHPYNYPFSDSIPENIADLYRRIAEGATFLAPALGQAQYDVVTAGLAAHSRPTCGESRRTCCCTSDRPRHGCTPTATRS